MKNQNTNTTNTNTNNTRTVAPISDKMQLLSINGGYNVAAWIVAMTLRAIDRRNPTKPIVKRAAKRAMSFSLHLEEVGQLDNATFTAYLATLDSDLQELVQATICGMWTAKATHDDKTDISVIREGGFKACFAAIEAQKRWDLRVLSIYYVEDMLPLLLAVAITGHKADYDLMQKVSIDMLNDCVDATYSRLTQPKQAVFSYLLYGVGVREIARQLNKSVGTIGDARNVIQNTFRRTFKDMFGVDLGI